MRQRWELDVDVDGADGELQFKLGPLWREALRAAMLGGAREEGSRLVDHRHNVIVRVVAVTDLPDVAPTTRPIRDQPQA